MTRQHHEVDLSLKIYLGHVKVTSCATNDFLPTKIHELKEHFDTNKITLEEYVQGMSTHTNV